MAIPYDTINRCFDFFSKKFIKCFLPPFIKFCK